VADGASGIPTAVSAVGSAGGQALSLQAYACPSAGAGRGFGPSTAAAADGRAAGGGGVAAGQSRETARALAMLFPPPPLPRPGVNACQQPAATGGAPAQLPTLPPQQQRQWQSAAAGQHAGDAWGDRRMPGEGGSAHIAGAGEVAGGAANVEAEGGRVQRGRFGAAVSAWYGGSLAAIQLKPWRSAYGGGGGGIRGAAAGDDGQACGDPSAAAELRGSEGRARGAGDQRPPPREAQQQQDGAGWRSAHMPTGFTRVDDPMAGAGGGAAEAEEEEEQAEVDEQGEEEEEGTEQDAWIAAERLLARAGRSSPGLGREQGAGPAPSQADMWRPLQRRRHPARPEAPSGATGACANAHGAAEGDDVEVRQHSGLSSAPAGASFSSSSSSRGEAAGPGVRRAVRLQGLERLNTAASAVQEGREQEGQSAAVAGEEGRSTAGRSRGWDGSTFMPDECPPDAAAATRVREQQAAEGDAAANENRFVTQLPRGAIVLHGHRPRPASAAGAAAPAAGCGSDWDTRSPRDAAGRAASPGLDDEDEEEEGAVAASAMDADSDDGEGSGCGERLLLLRSRRPPRNVTPGDCASDSGGSGRRDGACAVSNCTASSAGGLSILFGDAAAVVAPARAAGSAPAGAGARLDAPVAAAGAPELSGLAARTRGPEACTRYASAAGASGIQFSPPRPRHTS
jgi:hypothetical protein